jgi:hypothetical protein
MLDAENRSLFGEKAEAKAQTPFVKVSPASSYATQKKSFVAVSMSSAFDKHKASSDAMLIIRTLAHQDLKKGSNQVAQYDFLNNVTREISLKKGDLEAEIAARDALINRFFKEGTKA